MEILQKYKYHFGFLVISVLAFWQIVFFVHPVKYDIVDYNYPFRYFIGECLQHGKLPLWNPYQNLGYPIHADPSSGVWYPIVWIIGYTSGYTMYTIGVELVLHIFLAGIGFYTLSKTLRLSNNTAFVAGVSYMLCGVFVNNAQHLSFIISACWLPFVLNYYFKMVEEPKTVNSITASFFLFLMITGGYPAFTIILFYLLLLFFSYFTFRYIRNKQKNKLVVFIKQHLIFLIITLLLSSAMLIAIYEVTPFITRISQFTIKNALIGPFSPQSSVSFVLPFASVKDSAFLDSDISMSNIYFGLGLLIFFLYGLFLKKPMHFTLLLGFALFSLLAAFGAYLPVRAFLFEHVPMMNLFRFPSVFRLFVIIGFLLTAAYSFEMLAKMESERQRKNIIRLSAFFVFLFISTFVFLYKSNLGLWDFITKDLFVASTTSTLTQHIAFQSVLQIGMLVLFILILLKTPQKNKTKFITLLIIVDLLVSAQLNEPYTAYYGMFSARKSNEHIQRSPAGFPLLADKNISDIKPDSLYYGPFWKNLNVFQKQISPDGYNPFCLTGYETLRDSTPQLFKEIIQNKIAFLSDKAFGNDQINQFKKDSTFTNKTLFFKKQDLDLLKKNRLEGSIGDTVQLIHFAPDSFIVRTKTLKPQVLTLLQNNYIGWEVFINSKKVSIYTSNGTFISTVVPGGKNSVLFTYKNDTIKIAFFISLISVIMCLLIMINSIRNKNQQS